MVRAYILILIGLIAVAATAFADDESAKDAQDFSGTFEELFTQVPILGGPLSDLHKMLVRLSGKPDPAFDLNFLSATEAVDALPIMEEDKKFAPHQEMRPLFTINGRHVRASFRVQQEKRSLTGENLPYKPGDAFMPFGFDYNPDFQPLKFSSYYSEMQTSVFFAIEF